MFSLLNMNKIACVPAMEKGLSLMVFAAAPPMVGRGPTSGDNIIIQIIQKILLLNF